MIEGVLLVLLGVSLGWSLGRWQLLVWFQRELDKVRQRIADAQGTAKENWLAAHKAVADLECALRKQ